MADDRSNTKSEEGTTAFHKKRSRRVSFAENTSIHVFDRDEESETPSDPKNPPDSPSENLGFTERASSTSKQFLRDEEEDNDDDGDNYNDDDDDENDELGPRSPFLRLIGSPSPGGSTIGSATSNDDEAEDNFFGPVSASFIRRRLLDSAASDENHEPTMDSTAFSMHFRSIARSDSEGDLKTTTGLHNSFEEKTPVDTGSSMALTVAKKPTTEPSVSTSKLNTGSDSNDMSLVGEYHHKYDYGKLSPTLDALLAEGSKDLHVISTSNISILKSPRNAEKQFYANNEIVTGLVDLNCGQDNKLEGIISCEMLNEVGSRKHNEQGVANAGSKLSPGKQATFDAKSASDAPAHETVSLDQSIWGTPPAKSTEPVKDAFEVESNLDFTAISTGSPSNPNNTVHQLDNVTRKVHKSPLISSLTSLDGASLSQSPWIVTPYNQASDFLRSECLKDGGSLSSIQRSISKLRRIEAYPFSAALNAKLEDSNSRSLVSLSKMIPLDYLFKKDSNVLQANCMRNSGMETLDAYLEQSPTAAQEKRERVSSTEMDDNRIEMPKNVVPITVGKMQPNLLTSAETRDGYRDKIGSPHNSGHSPEIKLMMPKMKEFTSSPLGDGKQHHDSVNSGPGHVTGSGENFSNTGLSTTAVDRLDSLYIEKREQSSPLNLAIFTEEEMVDNREVVLHDASYNSETRGKLATFSKDIEQENLQAEFTKRSIAIGGVKTASLVMRGTTEKTSCQKNLTDQFCQSTSTKELHNVLLNHNDSLPEENVRSPSANQMPNEDVSSSERKRKNEDQMIEKNVRSPKLNKCDVSGGELSSDSRISCNGRNFKNPAEIHTRFSKETNQLLSQSVDMINLHAIDRLVDILGLLQRSKIFQLLSAEIQSQKKLDLGSNILHKRTAEIKLLLCKIAHEQAKLQLLHVKREKLLKRVQSLACGVQASEVLRLNCLPKQCLDVQVANGQSSDDMTCNQEIQTDHDKVASLEHTLEDIDRRISSLTKSLYTSCKIKGEPGSVDTIAVVNNHLMKKGYCQILRKDFQLWVVDSLESRNGEHTVMLNYLDLMIQRLTVTTLPAPSIFISNKLNDVNIGKNFKDMDACTAFGFVFSDAIKQKHVSSTSLGQETQMSSSLLGNLLDVVEEIQAARTELTNLTNFRFCTPLAEFLHLELYYFDSKLRRKATVTLDLSCLKRGIYPSVIIPCCIEIPDDGTQTSSPAALLAEITAAVQNLRGGYLRIQRLCRCISKLVSPSKLVNT